MVHFCRSTLQHIDSEAVEIGVNCPANRPARSNPMQTPSIALGRGVVPVLIESGSASMYRYTVKQKAFNIIYLVFLCKPNRLDQNLIPLSYSQM